jgi:hypothetical protein
VCMTESEANDDGPPECLSDCPDIDIIDGSCEAFGGTDPSNECTLDACEILVSWEEIGCV